MPKYRVTVSRPFESREWASFDFESDLDIEDEGFAEAALAASEDLDDSYWEEDHADHEPDYQDWQLEDAYEPKDERQVELPL